MKRVGRCDSRGGFFAECAACLSSDRVGFFQSADHVPRGSTHALRLCSCRWIKYLTGHSLFRVFGAGVQQSYSWGPQSPVDLVD
jgi:hypothetical protein